MFIPKQWLFVFGLSCVFGLALVWLFTQNAILNAEVSSLEDDVVALEVDLVSMEGTVDDLVQDVAARQAADADDERGPAARSVSAAPSEVASARYVVPALADGTPLGDPIPLDVGPHGLRTATQPQILALDVNWEDLCTFPQALTDGQNGDDSGSGGSGGVENEVSIEANNEVGNYATNSGNVIDSFFLDGGQGDIGLNVVESVLTGVNFNIVHLSGENSLNDSGNTDAAPVTDNVSTATNEPTYTDNEFSTPVAVSGSIDSSNSVADAAGGSTASAPLQSAATATTAPSAPLFDAASSTSTQSVPISSPLAPPQPSTALQEAAIAAAAPAPAPAAGPIASAPAADPTPAPETSDEVTDSGEAETRAITEASVVVSVESTTTSPTGDDAIE